MWRTNKYTNKWFIQPLNRKSASKLSFCRPKNFVQPLHQINQDAALDNQPDLLLINIKPAHVPNIGFPLLANSCNGSIKPYLSINLLIVVLSPPGRIKPSRSVYCSTFLTTTASAPHASTD